MEEKIIVSQINDHIYLFDENHEATGYLVIGKDKALVIDTMNGIENVKAVARRYTDLPLMLVNTHGHPDHIHGNIYFDEAYINPNDWYVTEEFIKEEPFVKFMEEKKLSMPPFKDINDGDVIDLGDIKLEVIEVPGHTPGQIFLLLRNDRILFTGDGINHHLWLQLHHCTSMEMYRNNLKKVMYLLDEADYILHGHAQGLDDISLMKKVYDGIEEILDGKTEEDAPYKWFGGEGRAHKIPDDDGVICYVPVPDRVKKMRKDWAENDAKRDAGLTEPDDVKKFRNITYNLYKEASLLDVYIPEDKFDRSEKLPVLVNVHGGGYFYGDKELYRFYCMEMARYGFAVVNFNYRLSPEYTFPSPLQDINEVIRWIESHADEYGMDVNNLFMMGDSAGAQLASHYAAINSNPEFAKLFALKKHSLKIKGLCLSCGMYDLPVRMVSERDKDMCKDYLGEYYDVNHPMLDVCGAVTANYPETFVYSCPNDFLFEHCMPFAKLIEERGGKVTAKIYGTAKMKEVGHVFNCDFRLPIGKDARDDQAKFLFGLKE